MKITDDQTAPEALAAYGHKAAQLLCSGDFSALAKQFGYALAFERDPATAIRYDLSAILAELGASSLGPPLSLPSVSRLKPNDTALVASVEQRIPTNNGRHVLLELVVSAHAADRHLGLEQISAAD
jgi:hypothetical protein